ncbi:MAG TPA: hypothetical protein VJC14_01170 [Candidatus Paceibacterota bacterium]
MEKKLKSIKNKRNKVIVILLELARHQLHEEARNTDNGSAENQINNQIDLLEAQRVKVDNFILKQEERFSLFGWLVSSL